MAVSSNVMTMTSPPRVDLFACSQAVCYSYLEVLRVLGDEGSAVGYLQGLCVCLHRAVMGGTLQMHQPPSHTLGSAQVRAVS